LDNNEVFCSSGIMVNKPNMLLMYENTIVMILYHLHFTTWFFIHLC